MRTLNQGKPKWIAALTVFLLGGLACNLTDIVPEACSTTWLVTQINVANADPDMTVIDLDPGCVYTFDSGDFFGNGDNALPKIDTPITLNGNGATVERNPDPSTPDFRLINILTDGDVAIDDLTLSNGVATQGGAIFAPNVGNLEITNVNFISNSANQGGAISTIEAEVLIRDSVFTENTAMDSTGGAVDLQLGFASILDSTFTGNQAAAGGAVTGWGVEMMLISTSEFSNNQAHTSWGNFSNHGGAVLNNNSILTIGASTFTNNQTDGRGGAIGIGGPTEILISSIIRNSADEGGGIFARDNNLKIEGTTIATNQAMSSGSGVHFQSGQLEVLNSTISGNILSQPLSTREGFGSAIHVSGGTTSIAYSTITDNSGPLLGSAIYTQAGSVDINNSIVAENTGGDCGEASGGFLSGSGANLDSDGSCPSASSSATPGLGGLSNNGGPTMTHELLPGSPAIDAAIGACPTDDQRSVDRPQGSTCDLGSFESATAAGAATPPPSETPLVGPNLPPVAILQNANCRIGPSTAYGVVINLNSGQVVSALGANATRDWTKVEVGDPALQCWVTNSVLDDLDLSLLEILASPPMPTPTFTLHPPTPTLTPIPATGSIGGVVWQDLNSDGSQQGGEDGLADVTVSLGSGACSSSGLTSQITASNGAYNFSGLAAGTYCVSVNVQPVCETYSIATTSTEYTINLGPGGNEMRFFGFGPFVC